MKEQYKHTQINALSLAGFGGSIIFALLLFAVTGPVSNKGVYFLLAIIQVVVIMCSSMTVVVENKLIKIKFGPGLIRKTLSLERITSCRTVENPWYYGLGIHKIPNGWIYNISGKHGIELQMEDGKIYRIGSDKPDELEQVIKRLLQEKV